MGGEDADKIIRIPGETLLVKLNPEEVKYREKYLPDPKKLTDEKLVCTVCSVSLASDIHKGKDVFVHRALHVLVCQACYNFYGDGCFSVDEDGDDKYCRWCGQGGTLFLCSTCTCAFCQKCVRQNLKASVLADLDNDDWKCYICNPRPLFGCRAICWGAEELNKIGKEKEKERLQKQKERMEKVEERKKAENGRRSRKASSSEGDLPSKKRKKMNDSDSSSPEVMPTKRAKRETRSLTETGNMNGSISRTKKKRKDSSSDSESENERRSSRPSRASVKKSVKVVNDSDDTDSKIKSKSRKKKSKDTSDESSDEYKKKTKQRHAKKKADSSDDESDYEKSSKKRKFSKKKKAASDSSSDDEKEKKKKLRKKKKVTSEEDSSDDTKRKSKKGKKKKEDSSDDESDGSSRKNKKSRGKRNSHAGTKKKGETPDSDSESKKEKHVDEGDDEAKSKVNSKDSSGDSIIVKKRIKLAILWLNNAVKDISELGSLISMRATKFSTKKINVENLKTYDDVLNTVSKLKQLISGIHSNYEHIEKSLDAHLKPWKIMTGLEEAENEKTVEGEVTKPEDIDVSKAENVSTMNETECNDVNKSHSGDTNISVNVPDGAEKNEEKSNINDEISLEWSGMSADDDSNNEENNATKALINKADETLSKEDDIEGEQSILDKSGIDKGDGVKGADIVSLKEKEISKEKDIEESKEKDKEDESHDNLQEDSQSDSETKKLKKRSSTESTKTKLDETKDTKESKKDQSPKKSSKTTNETSESESEFTSESKKEESNKKKDSEKQDQKESNKKKDYEKKDQNECKKEESDHSKDSKKQDRKKNKKVKSPKKNSVSTVEASGSESEEDKSPKKEKSPQKTPVKEIKQEKSEKLKLEEDDKLSGEESSRESVKEKSKATGKRVSHKKHSDVRSRRHPTPEKFCSLESFSARIRSRWMDEQTSEEMNLKTSVGLDSSEESDNTSEQVLKKENVDGEVVDDNCKKTKIKKSGDNNVKDVSTKKMNNEIVDDVSDDEIKKRKEKHRQKSKESRKVKAQKEEVKEETSIENKHKRKKAKEKRNSSEEEEHDEIKNKSDKVKKKASENNTKKRKEDASEDEENAKKIRKKDVKEENKKSAVSKKDKNRQSKGQKMSLSDDDSENEKDESIKEKKDRKTNNYEENEKSAVSKKDKNRQSKGQKMSLSDDDSENEKDESSREKKDGKTNNYEENEKSAVSKNEKNRQSKGSDDDSENEKDESIEEKKDEKTNNYEENNSQDEEMEISTVKIEDTEDVVNLNNLTENDTKFVGLDSSSEETFQMNSEVKSDDETSVNKNSKGKDKCLKSRSVRNQSRSVNTMLESSDEDEESESKKAVNLSSSSDKENRSEVKEEENSDAKSPDLVALSSTDSSDSEIVTSKKRKKKSTSNSDSDLILDDSDKEKKKKKRKLLRCLDSSNESGESGDEEGNVGDKSITGESPGKGGRKNIKKIRAKDDLADATKEAAEEEKERRRRIEERQKLFNELFEVKETKRLEKLVLDFDPESKEEIISVNQELVEKMKPHQARGVKFMWDSCFESIKRLKKEKGSGCILAHCMGLGKTFQVISLVHTVLTHEDTKVHTVMVVCPLSTVLNWYNEFEKWLDGVEGGDDIEVFHLTRCKQNVDRARELRRWQHNGGVLIIGYEMFRNLACETSKKFRAKMKKDFQETLIDPGADLIICDEGHMLKNEATALSKAMSKVKSLRRIVLTGTPMQNNLKEYHCMVQFVKPNLLGTRKEFLNRFVNPITNGQFVDSTDRDVKIMKRRAHVLHKMLEGLVQRFDYNVLTPFLPPKHEYVISLCLSELQVKLYQHYLENFSQQSANTKAGSQLFMDWQALGRIWTHPRVLKMSTDKENLRKEKQMLMESDDEEGSLKDFIDDGSDSESTAVESSDDNSSNASIKSNKKRVTRGRTTRATRSSARNEKLLDSEDEEKDENAMEYVEEYTGSKAWWSDMVEPEHLDDIRQSAKLVMLFAILRECEMIEDKVLVFSQSLFSLDLIEYFLDKIDLATQEGEMKENLGNHQGTWAKGLDYFRLDGSTSSENRNIWCKSFNREDNSRARLFLISTRAGGLGINLTAANRVIIFDASWNPSHDVQSIFRVYRFGQKKPCYVYRFIAHGTMEEKVYDRQVAKQSMSNRVVDEQQVHRHFSMNDLNELYTFTPPSKKEDRETPALPKDALMAEILTQCTDWIEKYHEHDSLLENVVEEELNEEERKLAWEDYENDKKGLIPPAPGGLPNTGIPFASPQMEHLRQALRNKYPDKSEQEINQYAMMLFYQVKQQQMMQAPMQAGGSMPRPAFPNKNLTPEQMFNLQQQQMRMQYLQQVQAMQAANLKNILPKQQAPVDYQQQMLMQQQANLARLQMQKMQQQFSQNLLLDRLSKPPMQTPPDISQMSSMQLSQLQNMAKRYDNAKQKSSVTLTEIKDTPPVKTPSGSKT